LGRLAEATAAAEEGLEAGLAQNTPRIVGAARLHLAHVLLTKGQPDAAANEARLAAAVLDVAPGLKAAALAAWARASLGRGDPRGALDKAEAAVGTLQGMREMFDGLVRLTHVDALAAAGLRARAKAALDDAVQQLRASAQRIADAGARAAFLGRVPEHARLEALLAARDAELSA
jgi:predicted negative regulator of RcsB-dependent stress response